MCMEGHTNPLKDMILGGFADSKHYDLGYSGNFQQVSIIYLNT